MQPVLLELIYNLLRKNKLARDGIAFRGKIFVYRKSITFVGF